MYALLSTLVMVMVLASPLPGVGDAATVKGSAPRMQAPTQAPAPAERVDINTASAEDLKKVPGLGEALAQRIVAFREEHGRFEKVDDLLNVRGIGVTSLEKLRPHLIVEKIG